MAKTKAPEPPLKEYKYIGGHAESLDGGRPLAQGEYTGPIEVPEGSHNETLVNEGMLVEVPSGTADDVEKLEEAAEKAAETESAQADDE